MVLNKGSTAHILTFKENNRIQDTFSYSTYIFYIHTQRWASICIYILINYIHIHKHTIYIHIHKLNIYMEKGCEREVRDN